MEEINSKSDEAGDQNSNLEDKVQKTPKQSSKKKKNLNEESLRNILDNMKNNNIHILWIPDREDGKQGIKNLFEDFRPRWRHR